MEYSEKIITDRLNEQYNGNARYLLANIFIFSWESDFFLQKNNGYCYEFEVKISRSDFFHDRKKVDKHLLLANCIHNHIPNKFYYVVPIGMVSITDIPAYAGLIYFNAENDQFTTIKPAPFLHKIQLDLESTLCRKFYTRWLNVKTKMQVMDNELQLLRREVV